jgi:hypothetical protein
MIATNCAHSSPILRSLIVLSALLVPIAHADAPRQLMWADLASKQPAPENPFAKLTRDQLQQLSDVASARERKAQGDKTLTPLDLENERAVARKLALAGIDVDGLLAKRSEMAEQRRTRGKVVNAALDGQVVRMPGYLLPLEFSGKLVTEFLLVPWVGACIHTPPPPPNQIVHVRADKPFEFGGLFTPVWVTGQMATSSTKKSLYLIDGSSDIDVGYSLHASQVEPYKE